MEINSTLTHLNLSENRIGDSGAAALAKAEDLTGPLAYLNLFYTNRISHCQNVEVNPPLEFIVGPKVRAQKNCCNKQFKSCAFKILPVLY